MNNIFNLLTSLFPNFISWLGAAFSSLTQSMLTYTLDSFVDVFDDPSVKSYLFFLRSWGGVMFIIGVGLALGEFAANYKEGNGTDLKGSFKNIAIGLFVSFGFDTVPILLFRFTVEVTNTLIGAFSSNSAQIFDSLSEFKTLEPSSAEEALEIIKNSRGDSGLIFSIFSIVMFIFILKILLGNLKRSGILIILLTICPIHLVSIPRGYVDGFYSWCKQVVGQCVTFFVQNFLLALSILVFVNNAHFTLSNLMITLGILLAASEAPRVLQQFGLESSVRTNASQAIFAVSGITNILRAF